MIRGNPATSSHRPSAATCLLLVASWLGLPAPATGQLPGEVELIPPTEPEHAEATFEVEPGFRVELVASEPLVMDPVAMSFDERGRLFVAEMRGYNQGNRVPCAEARKLAVETRRLGRIKLLEDIDGDGRFDQASVYVDQLLWPSGLLAYDGGVFVASAPDLLFFKDTDGDGRADVRRVVFTGFGHSNWQHLPNSFRWGLDNRIHAASASGGGAIRCPSRPQLPHASIRGRDFAFDPHSLKLAATHSSAQFGMSFDLWGNTFLTSNSDHILLVYFEDRYIARNPLLAAPRSWRLIAAAGRGADVQRISPAEPHRVIWTHLRATGVIQGLVERGGSPTGYITAASGTTIYRGHAWPRGYLGDSFTGESSGNLLHRNRLESAGIGQVARRVDQRREFLASRDIWFRPVALRNGPDGNLYVADMYRQVINEGIVLPPDLRKRFDLTEGSDRGRIYRVVPERFQTSAVPDLGQATPQELVALLDHPNCWHYTTAARLLHQRQDPAAIEPLEKLTTGASPPGRMRAMYALAGLSALSDKIVVRRMADGHPRVREHAVRLGEGVLGHSPEAREKVYSMTSDTDVRVRYQLAFSLGNISGADATGALAELAGNDATDPWMRLAILSSSTHRMGDLFARLVSDSRIRHASGYRLLEQLAEQAGLHAERDQIDATLGALGALGKHSPAAANGVVRSLLKGLAATGSPSRRELRKELLSRESTLLSQWLHRITREASKSALDAESNSSKRIEAIESLTLGSYTTVSSVLLQLLDSREPQEITAAAIKSLGSFNEPSVVESMLRARSRLTPQLRQMSIDTLFSHRSRLPPLLNALEQGHLIAAQLDAPKVQLLLTHPDPVIRRRASRLLEGRRTGPRDQVATDLKAILRIPADEQRGREVFRRECSKCHRLEGLGFDLGLPLTGIKDRGREAILLNLLDPNRNLNPAYSNYVLVTDAGRIISGMISAETANSITLSRGDGQSDTVLRANIEQLHDTGLSLMPEGLDRQLSAQAMADLIAYLMSLP